MAENISTSESVLRYCVALTLSVVTLTVDLAPQWVALTTLATCYLAFTAMLQTDPVHTLASRLIGNAGSKIAPASHGLRPRAAL